MISFQTVTQSGETIRYTRAFEWGKCNGLCELMQKSVSSFSVMEHVLTTEDLQSLKDSANVTQSRANDCDLVRASWSHMCNNFDQPRLNFRSWFVFVVDGQITIQCKNCDVNSVKERCQQLQRSPSLKHWTIERLFKPPTANRLSLELQIDAISCLPSFSPSKYDKKQLREPLSVKWIEQGARHAAMFSEPLLMNSIFSPLTLRKQRKRKRFIVQNKSQDEHVFDVLTPPQTQDPSVSLFFLDPCSPLVSFQLDLIDHGTVRIIQRDLIHMNIIWNAVDAITGSLIPDKFSTSFVTTLHGNVVEMACDNCTTFANSLLDPTHSANGGVCPHKRLVVHVLEVYSAPPDSTWSEDLFKHFLQNEIRKGFGCWLLPSSGEHLKFFVLVPIQEANTSRTTEHAICLIRNVDGLPWVKCLEMRCTKGKMKSLKRSTSLCDLCIHLVCLFKDETCKSHLKEKGITYSLNSSTNRFQNAEIDSQLDSDGEDSELENDFAASTSFVRFDTEAGIWKPISQLEFQPIPLHPDEKLRHFAVSRRRGLDLELTDKGSFLVIDGHFRGPPCHPLNEICEKCSLPLVDQQMKAVGIFKLRTSLGCVQRNRFEIECRCGYVHKWNPSAECIHVINDGNEGGKV